MLDCKVNRGEDRKKRQGKTRKSHKRKNEIKRGVQPRKSGPKTYFIMHLKIMSEFDGDGVIVVLAWSWQWGISSTLRISVLESFAKDQAMYNLALLGSTH